MRKSDWLYLLIIALVLCGLWATSDVFAQVDVSGENVRVDTTNDGIENKSLQQAIDDDDLGGGFDSTQQNDLTWGDNSQQIIRWDYDVLNTGHVDPWIEIWGTGSPGNDFFFHQFDVNLMPLDPGQMGNSGALQLVPATATWWALVVDDAADQLRIRSNTADTENVKIINIGAGGVVLDVEGEVTLGVPNSGIEWDAAGLRTDIKSDRNVRIRLALDGGTGNFEIAKDAASIFQVTDTGWLTSGASGNSVPVVWQMQTALGPALVAVYDGTDMDINRPLTLSGGGLAHAPQNLTISSSTAAIDRSLVIATCSGAQSVTTLTGGRAGQSLTMTFDDGNCTMVDDNGGSADTLNLAGNFIAGAGDTLQMIHDGTAWRETSRSDN